MSKIHRKAELFVVFFYCLGHIIMSIFHEPWFDEALAWLIARDSSLYDVLFVAPHYEGHPALWHLILMPFAKLGMPYGFSLAVISLAFSGTAIALFVYKSPFNKMVRYALPFTYFLFYQYSVISRPYCMMMLAFVVMALTYSKRDKKPAYYVLSLLFLCMTSAYGIVIAGGICIAWLTEMLISARKQALNKNSDNGENRNTIRIFIEDYLMGKRIIWLLGTLLAYVIFVFFRILPEENTFASLVSNGTSDKNGIVVRLIYTFFASLSDAVLTNVFYTTGTLRNADLYVGEYLAAVMIGICIIVFLIWSVSKYKKKYLTELLLPYSLYSIFSALVYLYYHHIGINLLFIGYCLWIVYDDKKKNNGAQAFLKPCESDRIRNGAISEKTHHKILLVKKKDDVETENSKHKIIKVLGVAMLAIPIYWSIISSFTDIISSYGSGEKLYSYLSDNGLDDGYSILTDFHHMYAEEEILEGYKEYDPIFSTNGINLAPYLKKSYLINTPELIGKNYSYLHEVPDEKTTDLIYGKIEENGQPDIVIRKFEDIEMFGEVGINIEDYVLVYKLEFGNIKKGIKSDNNAVIYVRKELAAERGLKEFNE